MIYSLDIWSFLKGEDQDPLEGSTTHTVGLKIDQDDEPRSLLDSLNTWWENVTVGELPESPGLSRPVELKLLDLLVS